jgi:hypothetical protein
LRRRESGIELAQEMLERVENLDVHLGAYDDRR